MIRKNFNEYEIPSIIFITGKGFIAKGIKIGQKIESLHTMYKLGKRFDLDLKGCPFTHMEVSVSDKTSVSAEASGVEELPFSRYENKEVGILIAEPKWVDTDWQSRAVSYLKGRVKDNIPYDYIGFFAFLFRSFNWLFPKLGLIEDVSWADFCSEISLDIFNLQGGSKYVNLLEKPGNMSPEEGFKAIYQSGNFNFYIQQDVNDTVKHYLSYARENY